ncbi:DUF1214 domain-containing protein [Maribellus sediminis]|uniref:DUF1214 domain-containing protein n=1 Tax=Maribellus sediminis TaxID=2696285 RepID=UPI001430508F|nr:DUF1214 domain-containing protein [Maribellus sediminis]
MKNYKFPISVLLTLFVFFLSCNAGSKQKATVQTDENGYAVLTDEQIENIVKRSYQYVAMYNVNNKFALKQGGWNTLDADTKLKDHTMREIARPNNDSFYSTCMLDLRAEPVILFLPAFSSKYVSLMVTAYDHYVDVPKATRNSDFQQPEKILFYSDRTENYNGEPVEGIDEIYKTTGDFISAVLRIMPHANEPDRFKKIVDEIGNIKIQTLAEYNGGEALPAKDIPIPEVGKTDLDIFQNNLLEVMQFVFNHISFDQNDPEDRAVLEAYKPLGIIPGKEFDPDAIKIDSKKFYEVAEKVQQEYLGKLSDPNLIKEMSPKMFKKKGLTDLETILTVSIIGPIGLPMEEAMYPNVTSSDGKPLNAMNDYVVKMTKDELPPDQAFWSLTLYDKANGFFIPNDRKKYSVGENAGYKLNADGGIEIYIAAKKPAGVPDENWLPINRKDEDIDLILRVYVPDLVKMESWKAPTAEKL